MVSRMKVVICLIAFVPCVLMAQSLPEMDCLIEANTETDLSSSVNGVIAEILVERGDTVKKGQSIVQLEDSVERANVALAKARANFTHELKGKKTQVKYTKKRFDRIKSLYTRKAVSVSDHQDAENEASMATVELGKANHGKQVAKLELAKAIRSLERLNIKSPIDGIVVEKFMSPGESVEDKRIIRIALINPLKVEVIVPANYFGKIKPGMKAKLYPEILQDPVEAKVTLVDKIIDASSGTFDVRLRLPNPDHSLPGGIKCRVVFENDEGNFEEPVFDEAPAS